MMTLLAERAQTPSVPSGFCISFFSSRSAVQAVLKGEEARSSLQDAVAVVEFLSTFAQHCGTAKPLSLAELQHAAVWPLDAPALAQLYLALLQNLVNDLVSQQAAYASMHALSLVSFVFAGFLHRTVKNWLQACNMSSCVGQSRVHCPFAGYHPEQS